MGKVCRDAAVDNTQRLAHDLRLGSFPPRVLNDIGFFFNVNDDSQAFVDYVLNEYGTLETLLQTQSIDQGWGIGYAGELAYAYLQIGEEKVFADLLDLSQKKLESEDTKGANNWVVLLGEVQYAALKGNIEGAVDALQRAVDGGFRNGGGIESPIFENLRVEPKFEELRQTLASYVDEERAKLGMEPYLPVSALDDQKKGAVWQP